MDMRERVQSSTVDRELSSFYGDAQVGLHPGTQKVLDSAHGLVHEKLCVT